MAANLLPIPRVRNLSQQEFDSLLLSDRPVIIEDALLQWPALGRWNPGYLVDKLGDLRIGVRRSSSHIHPDFTTLRTAWSRPWWRRLLDAVLRGRSRSDGRMGFGDFVGLLQHGPEGNRYLAGAEELAILRDGQWDAALASLRDDYILPPYVPPTRLDSIAMWVSARGVRSHLHYDGNCLHNLNAQITGSKHVQMYSPAQMDKVYPYLHTSGQPYTFSQVDVEAPDPLRFPLFAELEGYEGTLQAGDLLLIPAYWYHTFKHLGEFNTNVNFWWRADFVRLTPVSARDYFGSLAGEVLGRSRIPPFWLLGWLRKMERSIVEPR